MARIFMLKGDINRPGHVDIPEESTTLREVVEQLGGGMVNGKRCKAVQIGGPSGGLLSAEQLDLPLHFQQLKKILELMGFEWAKDIIHVPFGLVSLEEGTMSTREGRVVFLEDVLNRAIDETRDIIKEKGVATDNIEETAKQVGIGAVVFNELSNNRIKDYVFSWKKVLDFNGETGPYVQYTYARAASILRNAGEELTAKAASGKVDPKYITSPSAYELAKLIYKFPQVVVEAGEKYEPSIVTRHIVDLAQSFNRFYHDEHILVDNEEEKVAKLALVIAAKTAIKNGLALLGMQAPERM